MKFKEKLLSPFKYLKTKTDDYFYDISVKINNRKNHKTGNINSLRRAQRRFIIGVFIYPTILFLIFYVGVNLNSIILAFKSYDVLTYKYRWSGLENFIKFAKDIFQSPVLSKTAVNSLILYAVQIFLSMPVHILISYFIYKKVFLSETFKVILFLPSIISSMVWVLIFRYFVDYGVPEILTLLKLNSSVNLLGDSSIAFRTIIFYNFWIGLAGGMLIYLGTMARIPYSITEAGKLDGMNSWQELWFIVLPLLYPLISIMLVTSVPTIFTNQANLYAFYRYDADPNIYTFGYYLFIQVIGKKAGLVNYPYASAGGLLFTVVVAPLTIGLRYILEKLGPSTEF